MFIIPEAVVQSAIKKGINELKLNATAFKEIFAQFKVDELNATYGQSYIDGIYNWFLNANVQVVQAYSFDASKLPCFSIHLASESEDESKAAAGDFLGYDENGYEAFVGPMSITVDIGIHGMKDKDHVLWLFYILSYILYRQKLYLTNLGIQIHTFSASDYRKEEMRMAENVWSRWVKLKGTILNTLMSDDGENEYEVDVDLLAAKAVRVGEDEEIVDL